MNDMLDDILGLFNVFDRLESWATFLFAPKSRRARRFSRLDLQQFSIPRADKMAEAGKRAVSLNETIAYLERFGVKAVRSGFDSQNMYFQVRRSQNAKGWVDTLLNVDTDGIPRLDHGRKGWEDPKPEQPPARFWRDGKGRGDELITMAQAAEIAGVTVQAIAGRIDRGLRAYIDPSAPNPQKGRRLVRRSDVEPG